MPVSRSPRPVARDVLSQGVATKRSQRCAHAPHRAPITHSHATLAYYTAGRSRVELRGEWSLRAGDVLLVPAGAPHRELEVHDRSCWTLAFSPPAEGAALLERVRDGAAAVVHIPSARRAFLEALFGELEPGRPAPSDAARQSLLTLILAEVDRAWDATVPPGRGGGVVVEALRFIERNCLAPLTVDDVAAAVGRTSTYVTTALTQATGRSARQWIVRGRMVEARRLLRHSNERVDVIAERVGYADTTHFIRMFRREHGATPAAWRKLSASGTPR